MVARYVCTPRLPGSVAPRPYLHPVTTLAGIPVTGFRPGDHRHHLGASLAVPLLNGTNFWGGRTFLAGRGPVGLDNHGRQRHEGWLRREPDRLLQRLTWLGRDGAPLATEERALTARPLTAAAWVLWIDFTLRAPAGHPLTIESPASRGRAGAGYGGFFWRAPAGDGPVRAFAGPGANGLHGSRLPWVALTGGPAATAWTLIFLAGDDPWFVRAEEYAGVCPALAWDRPLLVAAGEALTRRVGVIAVDGRPGPAAVPALIRLATPRPTSPAGSTGPG